MRITAEMIEESAIKEFDADLRDMSDEKIEREIEYAQRQLDEIEPWLEALCAMQGRRARAAKSVS